MESNSSSVHGLHHVTAISGEPRATLDFYQRVLGLRLVKRSVNQDAPETYHLFFADGAGSPGTDLTFFPWPDLPPGQPGVGQVVEIPLAVPQGTMDYWQDRLVEAGAEVAERSKRFGEPTLAFTDPDGMRLAIVETSDEREFTPWEESPVPVDKQIRGMHSVRIWERRLEATEAVLTRVMGLEKVGEDDGWHRYGIDGRSGTLAEIKIVDDGQHGQGGPGTVHHAAWRMNNSEEQLSLRSRVAEVGLRPSEQIDRFWFQSVYFREPGGVLFELATDGPGFTADEDLEHLGEELILPPWLEDRREEIEAALPPLENPVDGTS
ncbi:glyoxalase [Longibacter salinarum]|uniref:Glyoxalase n=1 Tax=Longibacter salinarum TaxID=1850348 RepID=A0A2A8CUH9_9BACT|nr:ring-cleaving dioxygenase [Longibacter salinarum]PEN11495.1 glyoxalase [Longibacter salinarum]